MNWTAVRLGAGWSKAARMAAWAVAGGLLAAGCRASGPSVGSGISLTDEHGDNILDATVVIPDGRNMTGQINFPTDVDWFKFRGIQGVGYALQIHGFPTDPTVRPDLDLNGNGRDILSAQIISFDGTQLVNSSGTLGGDPYDVDAAGFLVGTLTRAGDSRFMWICPTTNDYFINIRHRRSSTGIGAYRFRLGTSQTTHLGPAFTVETIGFFDEQSGQRHVTLINDEGELLFDGLVVGAISSPSVEFIGSLGATAIVTFGFFQSPFILFPEDTTFQIPHIHAHVGYPNVFFPEASENLTDGDPPHPNFLDIALPVGRSAAGAGAGPVTTEGTMALSDGTRARFPVTMERAEGPADRPVSGQYFKVTLHLDEAKADSTRGAPEIEVSPEMFRTITGWPFYFDLHPQPDMDLDSAPIAVSRPLADMYDMFETPLDTQAGNVVLRDGSRLPADRGGSGFNIYYDTSLRLFQVITQIYTVDLFGGTGDAGVFQPDYQAFVGDFVKVHRGGPGAVGPVIIDLGTMPDVRPPRSADPPFTSNTSGVFGPPEPEGFKQAIRQLTDAEAETLRDAFYTDGFYVEVTDRITQEPLMRAEGFLDISFFPTLDPCDLPPCGGIAPAEKPQKGTVTFALGTADAGPVDLYANGELLGSLSEPVTPDHPPACGLEGDGGTLATELWPGTYYWHAHTRDGKKWDGHVTVTGGACQLVIVKPDGA